MYNYTIEQAVDAYNLKLEASKAYSELMEKDSDENADSNLQ